MTDNAQAELREILDNLVLHTRSMEMGYISMNQLWAEQWIAKQALLDWHNKQIEAVLDRLDKSMPTAEQLTTKYGYHMPAKQYGYKLALHDIREVLAKLEAEL